MKEGSSGRLKRTIINLLITILVGFLYFYFQLPAINLHDPELYTFVFILAATYCLLSIITQGLHKAESAGEIWRSIKAHCAIPVIICVALVVIFFAGHFISAPFLRAGSYHELLDVTEGDFSADVAEVSFDQIPMLDKNSAERLGDSKMGELPDLVSQFEVSNAYAQINYNDRPVRVTYLDYGDFFKWWNNRNEGLPAYISVDMVSQKVNVVRLSDMGLENIKYSPSDLFSRKLERHLRFNYPTFIFDDVVFEIDEDGTPWWVCPKIEKKIGLFGGTDINGAVLVNAITGECSYYEHPPTWVDRVYLAELIMQQYDYYGTYINGFWNSLFGQRNVTVTTSGYNYIAMNDDVYMYTGVTSVGGDGSNLGFLLCNQRTKETTYYPAPGAIEDSAKLSAQGVVQDLGFTATSPLLLNVSGEPTYFMSLKDASQLVKQYAMVNVRQYQIVATGDTVAECESNYLKLMDRHGITDAEILPQSEVSGTVAELRSAVLDGNTRIYIRLVGDDFFYVVSAADSELAVIINEGDRITMQTTSDTGDLRNAYDIEIG